MTKRTDVHRPSAINPADYTPVEGIRAFKDYRGLGGTCAHCGHALRYAARFIYNPSGEELDFGEDCAVFIDSTGRVEYEIKRLKVAARNLAQKEKFNRIARERREKFEQEAPDVLEFLLGLDEHESFRFLKDMLEALEKWGSLTEKQTQAVRNIKQKREANLLKRLEEYVEPTTEAPDGRATVEGKVVSVKGDHSPFGFVYKMLVILDDGNKVWGTMPRSIEDAVDQAEDVKEKKVRFSANFKRSDTDDHFSYYKRPTKAEVL